METRLYVGGLGERVTEEDLRTTFSHLGSVRSVDIIRTKGRTFAYLNFLPSSDNSLPKLFSTYNGCMWKGGRLKLEKAKQHYIDRLKQEWAEDAELLNMEATICNKDENMAASSEPKSTLDLEKMQLRMFFPKLRKVKSLPFRGTGKHKYSFRRVEVPSLPVHFCDCPEHNNPTETLKVTRVHEKINNEGINSKNRFFPSKFEGIQSSGESQVHDSEIQDGGMNDDEINIMNSVMKKLLDRKTAKPERKDVHDLPKDDIPTFESQENKIEIDEETDDEDDDDDIKINVGVQNVEHENWELQTCLINEMAGSNKQLTSVAAKSNLGTQNEKVKLSSKKRKLFSSENNEKDVVSPILRKKVVSKTRSEESELNLELNRVAELETKKPFTSSMWSQKSSWKRLIDEGGTSSFQLSHISRDETNIDEEPMFDGETSSDDEKHARVSNDVHDEHKHGETNSDEGHISDEETSSDDEKRARVSNDVHSEHKHGETNTDEGPMFDGETSSDDENHATVDHDVRDEHKHSNRTSSDRKELERVSNLEHENLDDQSLKSEDSEGPEVPQLVESDAGLDIAARGSSWLQKSSWTQLVGGGNSSSFSISQILSGDQVEKQQLNKTNEHVKSEMSFGGTQGSSFGFSGTDKKQDTETSSARRIQSSKAPKGYDHVDSTITKKSDTHQKVSNSLSETGFIDTSTFIRSADSMKEWQAAKKALTSTLKKKDTNK
ncbi:protein REPRESSOR OF SILENCING 3 [Amaranthus tricolor]|uniref:protein REPRESSOR OF SILENCING 3 n=1 Tax=Amaranthus tricolor TaxID=29722 RepID=UPI00258AFC3A|nr:protein REPRESSOR OF SILENCING 3 [Amaranthus tricolor]